MDDKNKKDNGNPFEPETHSAFPRKNKPAGTPPPSGDKPMPSQPRSFSPVRPQRTEAQRKSLTTPADAPATKETPAKEKAMAPAAATTPAAAANATTEQTPPATADAPRTDAPKADTPKDTPRPQSSGAGGDTIRLRVQPRPQARTLNTSPGRGLRRRLPDIRQGKVASSTVSYGPFSMLFGFLWLLFKMVFFTGLVFGLGALIGFMVLTKYIKTPEVTVPNVSGMTVEEAFNALSAKNLGLIRLREESNALVAPGEIVSQQPVDGASAKEKTMVGLVISSGRSRFIVPNVVNEPQDIAENKIQGAQLQVGKILPMESPTIPAGNVISQSPIGGEGRDEAVEVDLMISTGPPGKSFNMPDLSGKTVLEARAALSAVGIKDVEVQPANAADTEKVLSHAPLVGKTVYSRDKVTLITRPR